MASRRQALEGLATEGDGRGMRPVMADPRREPEPRLNAGGARTQAELHVLAVQKDGLVEGTQAPQGVGARGDGARHCQLTARGADARHGSSHCAAGADTAASAAPGMIVRTRSAVEAGIGWTVSWRVPSG